MSRTPKTMDAQTTHEILKKVRQIEIRTNRLVDDTLSGNYHSVFKGHGMNFDEVREYVPGDDIRSIDWKVTARTGIAHIKKFTEERELTLMLMIDISNSGIFGSGKASKREIMAEIGSVLAFSAIRNNDKVGLVLFTDRIELFIPAKKGRSHILRVIREILYFQGQGTGTDLLAPLDFVNRVTHHRSVAFLISDFCLPGNHDEALNELAPKLRISKRRHDLISVFVSDPREASLPDVGWITLEDAETGAQLEINTSDRAVRQEYEKRAIENRQNIARSIRSTGVDLLELSTGTPYIPALLGFFKARQKRNNR